MENHSREAQTASSLASAGGSLEGSSLASRNRTAVNQNVLPSPGSLCTPTVPPMSSARRREIARPRRPAKLRSENREIVERRVRRRAKDT